MLTCLDQILGVQVRGTQSVVDCLLEYSTKHKAGLIIMGSQQVLPLSQATLPLASLPTLDSQRLSMSDSDDV